MLSVTIEVIGWVAALLILGAYGLLTAGRLNASDPAYQWMNVVGALGILLNSGWAELYRPPPERRLDGHWVAALARSGSYAEDRRPQPPDRRGHDDVQGLRARRSATSGRARIRRPLRRWFVLQISRIDMIANTGTYLDRHSIVMRTGDLAGSTSSSWQLYPGCRSPALEEQLMIDRRGSGLDLPARRCWSTGWDRHWEPTLFRRPL
jgi:hypothetical protein